MSVPHISRFSFLYLFLSFFLLFGPVVFLPPDVLSADEDPFINDLPLLAGCEYAYPPFCIVHPDGRADGFSVELLREAAQAMGREVVFRVGPWSEVKGWLESGEIDVLPLAGRTPERESIFDFTFPYLSMHGAIVVREETRDIQGMEDLKGRRVGVMKGDNAEEFLRRGDRGIDIHTTVTFEEALYALSKGRYDAVVVQRLVALRLIQEAGLANLWIIPQPLLDFRQDWTFAVRKDDKKNLALLNEGLAIVMADGTFRRLYAKWFTVLEPPSRRHVVVGGDAHYPPYEYLDADGRPAGYNVDLTRAIAREMDLDIEIRLGPWAEILEGLESGEIDALQGMFYSPQRAQKFNFTQAHTANHYVGVVRKGAEAPPASLSELKNKHIVVQKGDIIYDIAVENGLEDQISLVDTHEDVLRTVAEGHYDCGLAVRVSALHLIKKNGWSQLVLGQHPLFSAEYCYAVSKDQKALLTQLSEGLRILEETGEYRRIHEKWLGIYQDTPKGLAGILQDAAMVTLPLTLLVLAFFLWTWSLRRQVASRTKELGEKEHLLGTILDAIAAPVFYKNAQGVFLGCNQAFSNFLGLPKEVIIGKTAFDIAPREIARQYHDADLAVMSDNSVRIYETEAVDHDGTPHQMIFHKSLFHDKENTIQGIVGVMLDITERKNAEEKLKEREAFIRAVLDNLPLGIAVNTVEPTVRFDYMNDNFLKIYRTTREALSDPGVFWDVIYEDPEFREIIKRRVLDDCATGNPEKMYWEDVPIVRKGEEITFVTARNIPLPDRHMVISTVRDVTRRRKAEEQNQHLDRVLRAIRDINQLMVREPSRDVLIHEACRLLIKNGSYAAALIVLADNAGRPQIWAEAGTNGVFEPLAELMEQGELPPCCQALRSSRATLQVAERGSACGDCPAFVECAATDTLCVQLAHEDFSYGYLAVTLEQEMELKQEEREMLSEMADDLAYALHAMEDRAARIHAEQEHENIQRQLLQSQKMEAVGQLAGGVAHDFNNILQALMGYTQILLDVARGKGESHEELTEIYKGTERAASLTRQLLAFSRRQVMRPDILDLNMIVENLFKMLRRLIGEDVYLEWLPGSHLGAVYADSGMMEQVLVNLCVNARDAMPHGGTLTIETQNVLVSSEYCANHAWAKPGRFVLLSVTDTGCGMNPDTLEHVFEPFFTTKEAGKGTGLGLAMVYGIVKQHGGIINAYSELGKGTTFKIYLPMCERKAETVGPLIQGAVKGGTETILLAEDDEMVRKLAQTILVQAGYTVLVAKDGEEAVAVFQENRERVALLLLDVVMPKLSGKDAFRRIRAIRPHMPALFSSGYSENAVHTNFVLHDGLKLIQKPYAPIALLRAVREALDQAASTKSV